MDIGRMDRPEYGVLVAEALSFYLAARDEGDANG